MLGGLTLTFVPLNPDLSFFENGVDPDQMASGYMRSEESLE